MCQAHVNIISQARKCHVFTRYPHTDNTTIAQYTIQPILPFPLNQLPSFWIS